ncbi:acyl-coenzyme A synthetase ACSM3, mitochondrial [Trichonephila clavipes]|nr:acyl-coenzyme A synthetase ACSM3, mitochondrial [Trichonephila clavipes]
MTAQRYVHDIHQPHVLPLMQWLLGAIFSTRLSPHCYYPSLACPIPRFVSNRSYLGSFGTLRLKIGAIIKFVPQFFKDGTLTRFNYFTRHWHDLTSDCILWNLSDTGWAKTAYGTLFSPWLAGSCVFIHEMPRFSTSLTLQTLAKYPIDTFCAPPTAFRALVQEDLKAYEFPKLEHCVSGGEALNPEVLKSWQDGTGLKIYEGYGQTEMVIAIGTFRCIEHKPGSLGKPAPTLDIVILDENENELGPGITGEIALKKRNGKIFGLFLGYKDDPEKTKKALTENYFHTGDLAYYDEDGYFWFVGRNDDIINSAGYRIGPFEVESAIMEHPDVVEVAVTSSPDEKRGEVVKAFVVLKDHPESEELKSELIKELQEHTKRTTAPYKYPRKIEFVKELPKTVSGKIKRFELKEKEWKS